MTEVIEFKRRESVAKEDVAIIGSNEDFYRHAPDVFYRCFCGSESFFIGVEYLYCQHCGAQQWF